MTKEKVVLPELDATEKELCLMYINKQGGDNKIKAIAHYRDRTKLGFTKSMYMINSYITTYTASM